MSDDHLLNRSVILLRAAVCEGNLLLVRQLLLYQKLSPQSPEVGTGWPCLFYAIQYGQNDVFDFLLEKGHEKKGISRDCQGLTALMVAILYQNFHAFDVYLTRFPETLAMMDHAGKCVLFYAAQKGRTAFLPLILKQGTNVNRQDKDLCTPLHYASAYGHYDTVQLLMQHKSDPYLKNAKGWTALDYAFNSEMALYLKQCMDDLQNGQAIRKYNSNVHAVAQRAIGSISVQRPSKVGLA